jgi:branched-chain amino acid transport system permease protein
MVVLGGMANNKGAVAGAAVMTTIDRATAMLAVELGTSSTFIEFNYVRYVLVGILMIVMLMFRQRGLLPEKPVKTPAYEVMKD